MFPKVLRAFCLLAALEETLRNLQYPFPTHIKSNIPSLSGVGEVALVLGIISFIISIIDATKQVYEAVEDEVGLPTNFKKSATKLPSLLEEKMGYYIPSLKSSRKHGN